MSGCLWLFSFKMFHINLFAWLGFSLTQIYNIIKSLWQLVLQFLILRTMYCSFYIYFLTPERSFSGKEVGRHHTSCSSTPLHSGDNMTVCKADPGAGSHPPNTWNKWILTITWSHFARQFYPLRFLPLIYVRDELRSQLTLQVFLFKQEVWTDKQDSILI